MPEDESEGDSPVPTDRDSPVGEPVIRGDPAVTGRDRTEAVRFDPDDPESVARAAETVRTFVRAEPGEEDHLFVLRGAAACAALVRGEGSYKAAAERADEGVTVAFVRTWARVHDLPRSIRRHVAAGDIAPSAAKHVARLTGTGRLHLAWATLDHDLTVREVRGVVSDVHSGATIEGALRERGYRLGEIALELPAKEYCLLRQEASLAGKSPGEVAGEALAEWFEEP